FPCTALFRSHLTQLSFACRGHLPHCSARGQLCEPAPQARDLALHRAALELPEDPGLAPLGQAQAHTRDVRLAAATRVALGPRVIAVCDALEELGRGLELGEALREQAPLADLGRLGPAPAPLVEV